MNTTPNYRNQVWDYLPASKFACLIKMAQGQTAATEISSREKEAPKANCQTCSSQTCPQPINFLVNAVPSAAAPFGLAGELPAGYKLHGSGSCLQKIPASSPIFNGCNFSALQELADAKNGTPLFNPTLGQLRGFAPTSNPPPGLAILLGPWADYCLWCWSQHPQLGKDVAPILIFGKDNSCLSDEVVDASVDWGAQQVHDTAQIKNASDKSSKVLFGAIQEAAEAQKASVVEYIAEKRILVCNIWPWFRCGQESSGDTVMHGDFSEVPSVSQFAADLVNCLKPRKIACLGSWSYRDNTAKPDDWMKSSMLNGCEGASHATIDVFRHPSAGQWHSVWKPSRGAWGGAPRWGGKKNKEEFIDFIRH